MKQQELLPLDYKQKTMQSLAAALLRLVSEYTAAFHSIPEDVLIHKPSAKKWSKKEIIGHLVDSAQTNIRRIIVSQYEDKPHIVYNQDKWVDLSHYQSYDTQTLIMLWSLLNKHFVHVLQHFNEANAQRECRTQDIHTIEWLAKDYILHLKHHAHQVLDRDPIPYP